MSDSPTITQQYSFAVGEDGETDGIEPSEESVETSLETFGADVDHRERDTRMDKPEASSFSVDDRKAVTRNGGGEQHALFADTEDDQRTLGGERAANQCLFGIDDATTHEATDEPTEASETTDETPIRAVADGGRVEDDEPDSAERTDEDDDAGDTDPTDESTEHESADADRTESDHGPVTDDRQDESFDPDAETVADTWEGAYIYTSWGYGQTNVELAQITDVSESGKTILARRVKAECVEHGRGTDQLRPTPEQYGNEFRLHVRNSGGDPAFRGSYPYINGEMDDGTRQDSFLPFDNTAENSIHQTPPNHRH